MPKPVILLAFANEREEGARYLRNLPRELNQLRDTLEKAEDKQLCELVVLPNLTLDNLIATFQRERYRNRIAVFHYGGHAGSYQLLLEEASGKTREAHGEGLVPFLSSQKGLKLAFLNGCYSGQQAQDLVEGGIPAVIGTANAVDDDVACELAASFYKALGEGSPLDKAWREATYKAQARKGKNDMGQYYDTRSIKVPGATPSQFPWEAHYRPGYEDIKDWNLPDAANDSYFGLPPIPEGYYLPEPPYRFLERYRKRDARIFFGRGSYIRDLYHRLSSPHTGPAILLYGQSGVGKSSLLEAGLFPRLEAGYDVRHARREPEKGLPGHLMELLGVTDESANADTLLKAWLKLEADSGKSALILVLDQVEEAYTRPNPALPNELNDFLQLVSELFDHPDGRPKGKLLLSYRKEYDPEIEKACRQANLPKEKIFLDRIDRNGIMEVVNGLASTTLLQDKYRVSIEPRLAEVLADDLLADKDSPITPVLQIILTRMWQQEEEKDKRSLEMENYLELKKKGIFLDDFFQQQMAEIRAWEKQLQTTVESSGLALDLLNYHTTTLGTSESRNLDDLRQQYQHRSEVLENLILQFKSLYLLTSLGKDKSTLAHDTLAPIVQKELHRSEKPGQRALRILASKMVDYELNPERTYIDEEDLALVERGANGMRIWTSKEKDLIEKSRQRRAKLEAERKRNRNFRRMAVVLIALFAVLATILWRISEIRRAQVANENLFNQGRLLAENDPTAGLSVIWKAYLKDQHNSKLEAAYQIYDQNVLYRKLLKTSHFLNTAAFSPDGEFFAVSKDDNNTVHLFRRSDGALVDSFARAQSPCHALAFGDGVLFIGSEDRKAYRWEWKNNRQLNFEAPSGSDDVSVVGLAVGAGGQRLATLQADGSVRGWNAASGDFLYEAVLPRPASAVHCSSSKSDGLFIGLENGAVLLAGLASGTVSGQVETGFQSPVKCLSTTPDGRYLAAGGENGKLRLWEKAGGNWIPVNLPQRLRGLISSLEFTPDGDFLFASDNNGALMAVETANGKLFKELKGHRKAVHAARYLPEPNLLLTAAGDSMVLEWAFPYPHAKRSFPLSEFSIEHLLFAPDGQYVAAFAADTVFILDGELTSELNRFAWPDATPLTSNLAIGGKGNSIAGGSETGEVFVVDRQNGRVTNKASLLPEPISMVAFSKEWVAAADEEGSIALWNWSSGKEAAKIQEKAVEGLTGLAFSADGQSLFTTDFNGELAKWKLPSLEKETSVETGTPLALPMASEDGAILALTDPDSALLWMSLDDTPLKIPAHLLAGWALGEQAYISLGENRCELQLFARQGFRFQTLSDDCDVESIAAHPNGRWYVAGTQNGKLLVWQSEQKLLPEQLGIAEE